MNETLIERHNSLVDPDDRVFVLGDLMLGPDKEAGLALIEKMNGRKIVIAGNHDTMARRAAYLPYVTIVHDALLIKEKGYYFYLSHYPTLTANLEKESLKQCTLNLFGHTHQTTNFYNDMPFMYHVGVDSHNCYPVSIEQVIQDMNDKVRECKNML